MKNKLVGLIGVVTLLVGMNVAAGPRYEEVRRQQVINSCLTISDSASTQATMHQMDMDKQKAIDFYSKNIQDKKVLSAILDRLDRAYDQRQGEDQIEQMKIVASFAVKEYSDCIEKFETPRTYTVSM